MNPKNNLIVFAFVFTFLISIGPGDACLKRLRTLVNNKGKAEKPAAAELDLDDVSLIKYSHASRSKFYIEIVQDENKNTIVREMDKPPATLNQVGEFEEKTMHAGELEPDAEFINLNDTNTSKNSSAVPQSSDATPTPSPTQEEEEVTEEPLAPEDELIRKEWGGECLLRHWNRCNKIRQITVLNVINTPFQKKNLELDCLLEPILCLKNGWTVTRCHILCMAAQCNKALYYTWDGFVDFEGACKYR